MLPAIRPTKQIYTKSPAEGRAVPVGYRTFNLLHDYLVILNYSNRGGVLWSSLIVHTRIIRIKQRNRTTKRVCSS